MKRLLTLLAAVLVLVSLANAQTRNLSKNEIGNLKTGIKSENRGLQQSSIYFAGYYQINEVSDELRDEMLSNKDPQLQVLAALALYRIGDESVKDDLLELVNNVNEELKVRRMAKAIYDQWNADLFEGIAVVK